MITICAMMVFYSIYFQFEETQFSMALLQVLQFPPSYLSHYCSPFSLLLTFSLSLAWTGDHAGLTRDILLWWW